MVFSLSRRSLYAFSDCIITVTPSPSVCCCLSVHAMWNMGSRWAFNLSWHCYTSVLFWHSTPSAWERSHSLSLCHSSFVPSLLAFLLHLFLYPPSPPVTVNLTPANAGSSNCATNRWVGTVSVGLRGRKSGRGRHREWILENTMMKWTLKTHTTKFRVNVSLFDILMVHSGFSKQMMRGHCKWEYAANR